MTAGTVPARTRAFAYGNTTLGVESRGKFWSDWRLWSRKRPQVILCKNTHTHTLTAGGDSSMCVPSPGWTLNWASRLLALVGGHWRSHGVIYEEYTRYRRHAEQVTNTCPNLHWALHQRWASATDATQQPCAAFKRRKHIQWNLNIATPSNYRRAVYTGPTNSAMQCPMVFVKCWLDKQKK